MATRFKPDEVVERQILAELYEATEQTRGGHRRARARSSRRTRCGSIRTAASTGSTCSKHDVRPRPGACARRSRSCARPTRRSSASSRTTARKGMIQVKSRLDNEQWVQEPLPQGREPLHRQDLRDDHARGDRREDRTSSRRRSSCRSSTAASGRIRRRRPSRSPRRSGGRRRSSASRCPELYVRNDVPGALVAVAADAAGDGRRPDGAHRVHAAGADVHRRQAPRDVPRRALHQEPVPDAQRAEGASSSPASRSSHRTTPVPGEMAQAVNATAQELAKHMQPVQREALRIVVQKFIEDGAKADLKRWMQAVGDHRVPRRAARSARDLEIAKKIIARRAAAAGRSAAAGEDEGAARLLGERAVLRAAQDARHRGRLVALRTRRFRKQLLAPAARRSGSWSERLSCPSATSPTRRPPRSRFRRPRRPTARGSSRCRTRRRRAASRCPREPLVVGTSPVARISSLQRRDGQRAALRAERASAASVAIEDLGSRNGTFVGGARVREARGQRGHRRRRSGDRRSWSSRRDESDADGAARRATRRDRRGVHRHAQAGRPGPPSRAARAARAHRGRERYRQGAPRARAARRGAAARAALRRHQRDGGAARARRERAVRARARRVHRRARPARGRVRRRGGRDALPRRDRRLAARGPAEDPARARRLRGPSRRRRGERAPGRRARRGGDARAARAARGARRVPARPVPSARVLRRSRAASARAPRRHRRSSRASSCASSRRKSGRATLTARRPSRASPPTAGRATFASCETSFAGRPTGASSDRASSAEDIDRALRRDRRELAKCLTSERAREMLRDSRGQPQRRRTGGGPSAHLVPQATRRVSRPRSGSVHAIDAPARRADVCGRPPGSGRGGCSPRFRQGGVRSRPGPTPDAASRGAVASGAPAAPLAALQAYARRVLGADRGVRARIMQLVVAGLVAAEGVIRVMAFDRREAGLDGRRAARRDVGPGRRAEDPVRGRRGGARLARLARRKDGLDARRPRPARRAARRARHGRRGVVHDGRRRRVARCARERPGRTCALDDGTRTRRATSRRSSHDRAPDPALRRSRRLRPRRRRRRPHRHRVLAGRGRPRGRPLVAIRDRDFGDDDEREHEAFTVGDDLEHRARRRSRARLRCARLRTAHASAVAPPQARPVRGRRHRRGRRRRGVDARRLHARGGRPVRGERVGGPDACARCGSIGRRARSRRRPSRRPTATATAGPSGSPPPPAAPSSRGVAAGRRPRPNAAPIDSLVYRVLEADDPSACDSALASLERADSRGPRARSMRTRSSTRAATRPGCFAAALVRGPDNDGGRPEAIRALRYPQ